MTQPRSPGPDRRQQLELRVADGLASAAEVEELLALEAQPDELLLLHDELGALLRPAWVPDLADAVMQELGMAAADEPGRQLLRELLDGGAAPELAADVLRTVGLDDVDAQRADGLVRALLDGGSALELADPVLVSLGLSTELSRHQALGQALRAHQAAEHPDLADAVMVALGLHDASASGSQDESDDDELAPVVWLTPAAATPPAHRRAGLLGAGLGFPAVALAAAAALLLFFSSAPVGSSPDQLAFELSPINHVDIEDISSGDQVMVQVLQLDDDNAPTIIYIDELDDTDEGGTPL